MDLLIICSIGNPQPRTKSTECGAEFNVNRGGPRPSASSGYKIKFRKELKDCDSLDVPPLTAYRSLYRQLRH